MPFSDSAPSTVPSLRRHAPLNDWQCVAINLKRDFSAHALEQFPARETKRIVKQDK